MEEQLITLQARLKERDVVRRGATKRRQTLPQQMRQMVSFACVKLCVVCVVTRDCPNCRSMVTNLMSYQDWTQTW